MGQIRPTNEIVRFGGSTTCSACFSQDNGKVYIDFDAACDRGYGDPDVDVGVVQMDSLVLCEDCIRTAARLPDIGMTDDDDLKATLSETEQKLRNSEREAEKQAEYASRLEGVFDARPQPIRVPHRKRIRNRDNREDDD